MGTDDTAVWLDRKDRILHVDQAWDAIAMAGNGPDARRRSVMGRPYLDFVSDRPTQELVAGLIADARRATRAQALYRCDTPRLAREFAMRLELEDEGVLRIDHVCQWIQPHLSVVVNGQGKDVPAHSKVCSMCLRIDLPGLGWVDDWFSRTMCKDPQYTVCGECDVEVKAMRGAAG